MQSNDVSFIDYRLERFSIVLGSQVSDVGNILHQWLLTRAGASVKVADNYILMVSRLFGLVNTFYCIIQDTHVCCAIIRELIITCPVLFYTILLNFYQKCRQLINWKFLRK